MCGRTVEQFSALREAVRRAAAPTRTPHIHRRRAHATSYLLSAVQTPVPSPAAAAAADRPPDRYVVRPASVVAELLGAAELGEDELLLRLRELGLITYPSPLLGGLLEKLPDVLQFEVLARLDPTDVVVFGQVGRACRAAVVAFGVPQEEEVEGWSDDSDDEGTQGGPLLLRLQDFVGSVERLAWAKARGCPWDESVCAYAARGGQLATGGTAVGLGTRSAGVYARRFGRAPGGAAVGAGARVRVGRAHMRARRYGRTPGGAEVGAREWVPVEHIHLFSRRGGRAPECVEVGARAWVPVGFGDMHMCRCGRPSGGDEVGAGAPLPMDRAYVLLCSEGRVPACAEVGAGARLPVDCGDARRGRNQGIFRQPSFVRLRLTAAAEHPELTTNCRGRRSGRRQYDHMTMRHL